MKYFLISQILSLPSQNKTKMMIILYLSCTGCFLYLAKHDCSVAYTSLTFYKVPEELDHVYLVGLYHLFDKLSNL